MAGLRIGLLGGTFDPIHIGHLIAAETCHVQLELDHVLLMPAGEPWRKADSEVTAAEHRLAMTRLAASDNPHLQVDDREVRRRGPTYTVETLRELRRDLVEGDELFLILGEDVLADLPNWHQPEEILTSASLALLPRQGIQPDSLSLLGATTVERIDMPYIGISSSQLRARLKEGKSVRYLTPAAVEAYIEKHGLYKAE